MIYRAGIYTPRDVRKSLLQLIARPSSDAPLLCTLQSLEVYIETRSGLGPLTPKPVILREQLDRTAGKFRLPFSRVPREYEPGLGHLKQHYWPSYLPLTIIDRHTNLYFRPGVEFKSRPSHYWDSGPWCNTGGT